MNEIIKRIYESDAGENGLSLAKRTVYFDYPLHQHDIYELEYIYAGKGKCVLNGTSFELSSGNLIFCTPMDFASYTVDEPLQLLNITFTDKWIERGISDFLTTPAVLSDFSCNLLEIFDKEYGGSGSFKNMYLKNILCTVLIETVRQTHNNMPIATSETPSAFYTAAKYIRSHYREPLSVGMLANKFGYSSNYFGNTFRRFFNMSIPQFVNNIRLEHASKLFLETSSSITEIAYSSGFSSVSNFMCQFKKAYGVSPSEYRKQLPKKERNRFNDPAP